MFDSDHIVDIVRDLLEAGEEAGSDVLKREAAAIIFAYSLDQALVENGVSYEDVVLTSPPRSRIN